MAIDMIENNEMAALSQSRIGSKNFVNDKDENYANFKFLGLRINFFGDETAKRNDEKAKVEITSKWAIDPKYANNCDYLETRLAQLENEWEALHAKNLKKRLRDRDAKPLSDAIASYKNALALNKCGEKKIAMEKAREEESAKKALETIAATPPPSMLPENVRASKIQNYLIYGIGGVIGVIALMILFRRKN